MRCVWMLNMNNINALNMDLKSTGLKGKCFRMRGLESDFNRPSPWSTGHVIK